MAFKAPAAALYRGRRFADSRPRRAARPWPAPSGSPGRRPCASDRSRPARPAPGPARAVGRGDQRCSRPAAPGRVSSPMNTRTPGARVQRSSSCRISRLRAKASNRSRSRSMSDRSCTPIRRVCPASSMSLVRAPASACSASSTAAASSAPSRERASRSSRSSVGADLRQRPAGEMLVEVVGDAARARRRRRRGASVMMRFCTSLSVNTRITSTRCASSGDEVDRGGRRTARAAAR